MAIRSNRTLTIIAAFALAAVACLQTAPAWAQDSTDSDGQRTPVETGNEGASGGTESPAPDADSPDKAPEGKKTDGEPAPPPAGNPLSKWFLPIMIGGLVLMWIFMGASKRKAAAKRRELLAAIKKGDKVTSIGGIVGTVVEAREDEVILKIDDNTRMHLARWAVRGVGEEGKAEDPDKK